MSAIQDGTDPSRYALLELEEHTPQRLARRARGLGSFQRRLVAEFLHGKGIGGVARVLAEVVDCPVQIADASRSRLASSHRGLPLPAALMSRAGEPITTDDFAVERRGPWLVATVADELEVLGWVMLREPLGPGQASRIAYLESTAAILALELGKAKRPSNRRSSGARADLALVLLKEGVSPRTRRLAQQLDYDLTRPHVVAAITGLEGVGDAVMQVEQTARQVGGGSPLVARAPEHLFVFSSEPLNWELLAAVLQRLDPSVRIGVSGPYGFDRLPDGLYEALFVLEAKRPGHGAPVVRLSDLGIWQLVLEPQGADRLRRVVGDWLGPLIAYDERRQSEFVKTLRTFLWGSCSVEATASALFIHRHTLRYRLGRCEQILGLDLSDQENRFQLSVACVAQEVLAARERLDELLAQQHRRTSA